MAGGIVYGNDYNHTAANLVNRLVPDEQTRKLLLTQAAALEAIRVNTWTISDIDLIAVGAFSPLTGFHERSRL